MRRLKNFFSIMYQSKNIECEVRGCITQSDFNAIMLDIERDWGKLDESPELVIFFKGENDLRLKLDKNGAVLVLKKTIDGKSGSRQEIELKFKLKDIYKVISFINQLGFKEGLFSYCHCFKAHRINKSISIKFNTKIGDLLEIDELVSEDADFTSVRNKLVKMFNKYGLNVWTNEAYKQIINDSWNGVSPEALIQKGKLHPLIRKVMNNSAQIKRPGNRTVRTVASIIKNKSNDYIKLEKMFKRRVGINLLSWERSNIEDYNEKVSVVIPTYNSWNSLRLTLKSLEKQKLHKNQKKLIEVIVIDDGSKDRTEKNIQKEKFKLNLRYIKQNNLGRVYARNLGAAVAQGRVLVFFDSDVILDNYFLNEHIKRHHYLDNIVLVGFKENINKQSSIIKIFLKNKKIPRPNITKDFRFEKTVERDWMRMHRHVRYVELRKTKIIGETNNFKNFGKDRVIGVWDLPSMIITNAVSMKKESFEQIGGFSLQFQGWGMEDTFLGACLIANDNYIIPCFSTGIFHIEHDFRSGSPRKKIMEFNQNVLVYLDLINKPVHSIFKQTKQFNL